MQVAGKTAAVGNLCDLACRGNKSWLGKSGMLGTFILLSFLGGVAAACAAPYAPAHVVALERFGGTLMVAGLALLGAALPAFP
jgi:hypothetical protein